MTLVYPTAPAMDMPRKSATEVVALHHYRKQNQDAELHRMRMVQAAVNGDIVLPLPEIAKEEKPAVANLAQQGLNQLSRRVASVEPSIFFPSLNPGQAKADKLARNRTRIMNGWHKQNDMKRRIGQRARYFLAYASAPVIIKPDYTFEHARWIPKNPLFTFPGEDIFDDHLPPDCIFESTFTYESLRRQWGDQIMRAVSKPINWDHGDDTANAEIKFKILEFIDDYEHMVVLRGYMPDSHSGNDYLDSDPYHANHVILSWTRNFTDRPLVIVPGSINLDKQLGHFDGMLGMYQTQAMLMAMTIVAQKRSVWAREWVISNPGESAQIVNTPDPGAGKPGRIQGGRIETQNLDPAFSTLETMDRLEYAQRMTASLPSEWGGFSQSDNVRTGRRGQQVMGAAIDFTIAEVQDTFARALMLENQAAIAIDKTYLDHKKVIHIPTRAFHGQVEYTPSETWETDVHIVDYPIAGTDMQNLPIEGGQRVQMGVMSRRRFMDIDPMIKDAEGEEKQIQAEALEQAFFEMVRTLAGQPDAPMQPEHLERLYRKLYKHDNVFDAFAELQEEVKKEQSTPAQTPAQEQPGIGTPGQGVEQPPASIPEMEPSMNNLTQLLSSLGTQQQAQAYR